ncbi:MAG TPA: GNAT family N-acetyltransferase [Aquabacterium sp.]|uniref:GNAT family N-acetyltransferase n=1 Tax=Aquabacterium sp. TaxID=1872578 RepID=UPI002E35EE57|nr:GNAT family N-acetyltransferase [Aquabacterium sp.]HEX5354583.1 GNAT family N-acetyltransferase [Aquabacterium sp.]
MQINVTLEMLPARSVLEARWRELEARSNASFYTSWSWIGCWLHVLPSDLSPQLLVARHAGRIVGMGIVVRGKAKLLQVIPVPCWYLHATGQESIDELTIEYNGFLVERGHEIDVKTTMVDHLLHQTEVGRVEIKLASRQLDLLARRVSHKQTQPQKAARNVIVRSTGFTSYMVNLAHVRASANGYLPLLSSNTRSQIRRSIAAYKALGELTVEEARTPQQAQAFMAELRKLHGQTWLGRGERSGFSFSPTALQFHDQLIEHGFERGEIQLLRVSAGGQDVGYLYNLIHQGHVVYYQSGLRYGVLDKHDRPGLVCHSLAIEHNARAGHHCYDFAAGNYRYKDSLSTHREPQSTHVFQRDGVLPRLDRDLRILKAQWRQWREHLKLWRKRAAQTVTPTLLALTPIGLDIDCISLLQVLPP